MVSKPLPRQMEEDLPEIDEGWWSSVLSDEETHIDLVHESNSKGAIPSAPLTRVDWDLVQEIFDQDEVVSLQVNGYNRGGLLVQGQSVQGFVPVSHLVDMPGSTSDEERRGILAAYVGRTLDLKVIECEPSQERIVLSERAALAGEGRRKQLFHQLRVGEAILGVVTNVTDFGVFVDLGGVEGLIHVSELSWGRVQHPSSVLTIGQQVKTMVLQVSEENSRVALSLKRLYANPWDLVAQRYNPGAVIPATVTAIMRFGAFARLGEGVEGLIHISSISMPIGARSVEDVLQVGQEVTVKVLHIDADRRRLGLGLVAVE
jgi:small subunit ribosomal protein S1